MGTTTVQDRTLTLVLFELSKKNVPRSEIDKAQVNLIMAINKNDKREIQNTLFEIQRTTGVNLKEYIECVALSNYDKVKHDLVNDIPDKVYISAPSYYHTDKGNPPSTIVYYPHPLDHAQNLKVCHHILEDLNAQDPSVAFIPFLVTPHTTEEGNLIFKRENKVNVNLGNMSINKEGKPELQLIGEKKSLNWTSRVSLNVPMWVYELRNNKGERIVLLSEKEHDLSFIKVRGQLITVSDEIKTGENRGIPVNNKALIVYDAEQENKVLSEENFQTLRTEIMNNGGVPYLSGKTFQHYRHPPWFERLIFVWLFSYKFGQYPGWPLHLGVIGPAGSGKSQLLNVLQTHFNEPEGIFDGAASTLKMLGVSYGGRFPSLGSFCLSKRLALVDELFAPMKRTNKGISENDETHQLVNLLEHQTRKVGSGRGESLVINPTARMLSVSNIGANFGMKDFIEVGQKISRPFLSRMLWYVQTDEHVDFCQSRSAQFQTQINTKVEEWQELVLITDYMQSKPVDISPKVVDSVHMQGLKLLPQGLDEVYKTSRYKHHIACLLDGCVKLRYLCEGGDFVVMDKDVQDAAELFLSCVASWNTDIDLSTLPARVKERYLNNNPRVVFEFISAGSGSTKYEIDQAYQEDAKYQLEYLEKLGLIAEIEGGWFPHWHSKFKERMNGG